MKNNTTYMNPAEVAENLGVDIRTVLAWIRTGELSAYNFAKSPSGRPRWKISIEKLAAFNEKRENEQPAKLSRQTRQRPPAAKRFF